MRTDIIRGYLKLTKDQAAWAMRVHGFLMDMVNEEDDDDYKEENKDVEEYVVACKVADSGFACTDGFEIISDPPYFDVSFVDWDICYTAAWFMQEIMRKFNIAGVAEICGSCGYGGEAMVITKNSVEKFSTWEWVKDKREAHKREILWRNFNEFAKQIDTPIPTGDVKGFKCVVCGEEVFSSLFRTTETVWADISVYTDGNWDDMEIQRGKYYDIERIVKNIECNHCGAEYFLPSLRRFYRKGEKNE